MPRSRHSRLTGPIAMGAAMASMLLVGLMAVAAQAQSGATIEAEPIANPTQAQSSLDEKDFNARQPKKRPPRGLTTYMGRKIALPMSYHGIPWLNRPERVDEERPDELLEQLELKEGMVVCDMGAGDGYHTFQMAPKLAPSGKVIAVDIQPEMLQALSRRMEQVGVRNIDTILGELWDPKLEPNSLDLILMVDVYHEFSHPVHMLKAIRTALKEDGLIALVEYRAEDPTVPIKPDHKMSKAQCIKEYRANGFQLVKQYDRLPQQHVLFFGKAE